MIENNTTGSVVLMPRFFVKKHEGGMTPHDALITLLREERGILRKEIGASLLCSCLIRLLSFGNLHRQLRLPADVIREQFHLIEDLLPATSVDPQDLRKEITRKSLPIPNYFLDPDDPRQFPPHIALLVILQETENESAHMSCIVWDTLWSLFALGALVLRLVLEVIGGAGAIWGGAEVFHLRNAYNQMEWRVASIVIGSLCALRFIVLNAPQEEDDGAILGPAGP